MICINALFHTGLQFFMMLVEVVLVLGLLLNVTLLFLHQMAMF